jgi:hypothetical protein
VIRVLAHGVGDASVLPLPLPVVLTLAGGLVLGAASWRGWPAPRGGATAVRDEPAAPSPWWRALGLVWAAAVVVLAVVGPTAPDTNPAPRLLLVVGWAGLVPLSLLAPGAWRALNPLRAISALVARVLGDPDEELVRPVPATWGWWPAVPGLVGVAVLEARWPGDPSALLIALGIGGLGLLGGAVVFGSSWYAHADPFEVFSAVVGRCSPLPGARERLLAPAPPGTVPVVGVLVGMALGDFVTDSGVWLRNAPTGPARDWAVLVALAVCIAVATAVAAAGAQVRPLVPALLPLVTGYAAGHYFAVLLIEGQATASQLATLARGGLPALSRVPAVANYEVLPAALAALVQLALILVPHVVAALTSHDLAARHLPARHVQRATAPATGVITLSAVAAIALRFSAA